MGHDSFIVADLPGLIEGPQTGAGLGDRFLGHVERCAAVIHLVDGTQEDVAGAYRTIRRELEGYGQGLAQKPELLCLSKCDALDETTIAERSAALAEAAGREVWSISAVAQRGVDPVLHAAFALVPERRRRSRDEPP